MAAPTERESALGCEIARLYADFHAQGGMAPLADVLRLIRIHVAEEVADQAAGLHRENAKLRAFVERIAKQKPEKPDYWTECGQCGRNSSDADDIINPT